MMLGFLLGAEATVGSVLLSPPLPQLPHSKPSQGLFWLLLVDLLARPNRFTSAARH